MGIPPDPLAADIARRIAAEIHPERIILFGSRARGDHRPDSDVDLLVVTREPMPNRAGLYRRICNLFPRPRFAMDLVLLCEAEYAEQRQMINTIAREAADHGRELAHA